MNPESEIDWWSLANLAAGAQDVGFWAIAALMGLAAVLLLRLLLGNWRKSIFVRSLLWVLHLCLWPLAVFALVHVLGVSLNAADSVRLTAWLVNAGEVALAVVIAMLLVEGLELVVWQGFARHRFGSTTPRILIGATAFLVYLTTAYIIVAVIFDVPVTGALVSSGILLGVIGLSLQDTIRDVFAGLFISLERPFRIGDWIVTEDGRLGKVLQIDWRATRLLSFNETVFVVPNSKIANSIIENRAEPDPLYGHYFRVKMAPEAPNGLVTRVLLEAVLSSPYVLSDPAPSVRLVNARQRPYEYQVYVYFENYETSWRGNADLQLRIHEYLGRVGLSVAGDGQEVHHRPLDAIATEEPTVQQLLSEIHLFQALSETELALLSQHVRTTRYRSGEVIIREGDAGESLLVITTGLVHVTRRQRQRRDVSVGRLGIGQCIGEMSLLTGRPRSATVEAVTDCEIVEIPKEGMNELFERRPDLVDDLARIMADRRAADDLVSEREVEQALHLSLQDIAQRLGKRIRSFFRLADDAE
jgi:small-conductance mechanosensitive channel/CRP-like cAMP-binding protein